MEGYVIQKKLRNNHHIDTYSGVRLDDQSKVILKLPHNEHPSSQDLAVLQHEYHLLKQLEIPGVIRAHEFLQDGHIPVLILENIEGESLANYLKKIR